MVTWQQAQRSLMKPNTKAIIVIALIILGVVGHIIWKSEAFQRTIFPKKYWSEKVLTYEKIIKIKETRRKEALLEAKKLSETISSEVVRSFNIAESKDLSGQETAKAILETTKEQIQANQDWAEELEEDIEDLKDDLEEAESQLARYQ